MWPFFLTWGEWTQEMRVNTQADTRLHWIYHAVLISWDLTSKAMEPLGCFNQGSKVIRFLYEFSGFIRYRQVESLKIYIIKNISKISILRAKIKVDKWKETEKKNIAAHSPWRQPWLLRKTALHLGYPQASGGLVTTHHKLPPSGIWDLHFL